MSIIGIALTYSLMDHESASTIGWVESVYGLVGIWSVSTIHHSLMDLVDAYTSFEEFSEGGLLSAKVIASSLNSDTDARALTALTDIVSRGGYSPVNAPLPGTDLNYRLARISANSLLALRNIPDREALIIVCLIIDIKP